MEQLDALRQHGWSYWAGYSHDYQAYIARAWKPRPKPTRVKSVGGVDRVVLTWCVSACGSTLEEAAVQCAAKAKAEAGNGFWWDGLVNHIKTFASS
jgi:hypothetical protein